MNDNLEKRFLMDWMDACHKVETEGAYKSMSAIFRQAARVMVKENDWTKFGLYDSDGNMGVKTITMKIIMDTVCSVTGTSISKLTSRKRIPYYVGARALVAYYAHERFNFTLAGIGAELKRDHTSIIYSIKEVYPNMLQTTRGKNLDYAVRHKLKELEKELEGKGLNTENTEVTEEK